MPPPSLPLASPKKFAHGGGQNSNLTRSYVRPNTHITVRWGIQIMRIATVLVAALLGTTCLAEPRNAKAAIQHYQLNIPRQSLDTALKDLAEQTGLQIGRFSARVDGSAIVGPVDGNQTPAEALKTLLRGTGLEYRIVSDTTIAVFNPKDAPTTRANSSGGAATPVAAPAATSAVLEEIVVTAQKREERLIDVPMAITAVTGVEIERRGVSSLQDLQYSVPGLSVVQSGPGQERIQIRGISTTNGLPTVGQYLDEMPVSIDDNTQSLDLRLIDMERIEVLRGPQGTLYGEGSMGGTIRYLTANPDLTRFGGSFEAQAGAVTNGDAAWRTNGVVNLPLVKDRVGLRLVAGYENTGGWIDSLETGRKNVNAAKIFTIRGKVLADITDNVQAWVMVLHQNQKQDYQDYGKDRQTSARLAEFNNPNYDLVNAVVRLDLGWGSLLNSFGYQKAKNNTMTDLSSVYVPLLPRLGFPSGFITSVGLNSTSSTDVYTDELRLASKPGGALDWTVGMYGRELDRDGVSKTVTAPGAPPFDLIAADATSKSTAWAAFGEADWNITDHLTVTGGLRYFHERRTLTAQSASFGTPATNNNNGDFSSANPRVNVSYKISRDGLVYASAAKGFRSGGFNSAATGGPLTYDPEKLWTYELGTKHQFLDHRLSFDVAGYYNDWKGVQSSFFPVGAALGYITNGGKVNGEGVDASLTAHPTDSLTFNATYGWNNLAYKTRSAEHAVGDPVDYAVRQSWSGFIDYRRPVFRSAKGFARLDYQHAGHSSIINRGAGVNVAIGDRDLLNARVGVDLGQVEVAVFANNLTDVSTPIIPGPYGVILQDVEPVPRLVGVNFKAKY
jgi:iron complex outermembrane receptor protein